MSQLLGKMMLKLMGVLTLATYQEFVKGKKFKNYSQKIPGTSGTVHSFIQGSEKNMNITSLFYHNLVN